MINNFCDIYKEFSIKHSEMLAEIYFVLDVGFCMGKKEILGGKELAEKDYQKAYSIFNERVKTGRPIQYILRKAYFMNDVFEVNENVLIPRDDTEILVKAAFDIINRNSFKKVLDMGTGSGIIAVELAKHTNAQVHACDVSENALDVAKMNACRLGQNVNFVQSDLFENINEKFDLIVSNPPYIPYSEKSNLQKEVGFEPENALFAEDKGLFFYKKIISQAKKYLNNEGFLAFEIGYGQANELCELLEKDFKEIKIKKDVSEIERVVCARLKN